MHIGTKEQHTCCASRSPCWNVTDNWRSASQCHLTLKYTHQSTFGHTYHSFLAQIYCRSQNHSNLWLSQTI
ncbi:hypothetical protein B566_EDAN018114 [Ephemera danica]|nr:hypothetical protein B566_EDAN018114 [Ephemera danica]